MEIKTCEEYVLSRLIDTENEVQVCKDYITVLELENERLKEELNQYKKSDNNLFLNLVGIDNGIRRK